jgi:hypothetical protein
MKCSRSSARVDKRSTAPAIHGCGREVAIKVRRTIAWRTSPGGDSSGRKAASALNHRIITIYEVESANGMTFARA